MFFDRRKSDLCLPRRPLSPRSRKKRPPLSALLFYTCTPPCALAALSLAKRTQWQKTIYGILKANASQVSSPPPRSSTAATAAASSASPNTRAAAALPAAPAPTTTSGASSSSPLPFSPPPPPPPPSPAPPQDFATLAGPSMRARATSFHLGGSRGRSADRRAAATAHASCAAVGALYERKFSSPFARSVPSLPLPLFGERAADAAAPPEAAAFSAARASASWKRALSRRLGGGGGGGWRRGAGAGRGVAAAAVAVAGAAAAAAAAAGATTAGGTAAGTARGAKGGFLFPESGALEGKGRGMACFRSAGDGERVERRFF